MKRSERQLYIPPHLRSAINQECKDKFKDANDKCVNKTENYCIKKYNFEKKISTERDLSSSSNQRNTEEYENEDSSDFDEHSCNSVQINDLEIDDDKNENNSNIHLTERVTPAENYHYTKINPQASTKISKSRNSVQQENYSNVKSNSNQYIDSVSNKTDFDKLLFNDDDNISDIEAVIDSYTKQRSILISSPNSDIVERKILEEAKYIPKEEKGLESTHLDQNDFIETTINANRNVGNNNFDIYRGISSIKSESPDYKEVFGNNYIPPPVPPAVSAFQLPPIHRLSSPVSSPYEFLMHRSVSHHNLQQMVTRFGYPRYIRVPSPPLHPRLTLAYSSHMPPIRIVNPPCLKAVSMATSNASRMPNPTLSKFLPQERLNPSHSLQDMLNTAYLHQSAAPQNVESYKQDSFYIPPPTLSPQFDGNQHISTLNPHENVQSSPPYSTSVKNKIFDDKIWPPNLKAKR